MKKLSKKLKKERIRELQNLLIHYAERRMLLNKMSDKAIKEIMELQKEN